MTIYIQGDLHGSGGNVRACLAQIDSPKEEDIIIVCGDAGLEYGDAIMGQAKKAMKKFPGTWIILRGNHDTRYWRDHSHNSSWHVEHKFGNKTLVQDKYSNIHYLLDEGGLYLIDNQVFLMIPGAYSIDKYFRLESDLPYEPAEQLTYMEWQILYRKAHQNKDAIDFVCAHTFPYDLEPKLEYLYCDFIDQETVDKTTEKWLNVIMREVETGQNFKHYFGGHLHDDKKLTDKYSILYKKVVKLEDYINE